MRDEPAYRKILTVITLNDDSLAPGRTSRFGEHIKMTVDGVLIHGGIGVGVRQDYREGVIIEINGQRPLYRTQIFANGVLVAEDQGLLWDCDMTRVSVKGKPG